MTFTYSPPTPWQLLHKEWCPRYGKVSADASVCTCDEQTRREINQAVVALRERNG